jgi:hypothetical protein
MKVAIFAILTQEQFNYLHNLASEKGIECQFVVEGDESPITVGRPVTRTPLTGEMLQTAANAANLTVIEVAQKADELGISTLEDAITHTEIPSAVKSALEEYL